MDIYKDRNIEMLCIFLFLNLVSLCSSKTIIVRHRIEGSPQSEWQQYMNDEPLKHVKVTSAEDCKDLCADTNKCRGAMFTGGMCVMRQRAKCPCQAGTMALSVDVDSCYKFFVPTLKYAQSQALEVCRSAGMELIAINVAIENQALVHYISE